MTDSSSIRVIVFTKDRPLQLDATLSSLAKRCDDLGVAEVHVIEKSSSPRYAAGYRVVAAQHPNIRFRQESDFKADLLAVLSGARYVMFVVDDTLFVGRLSLMAAVGALEGVPQLLGFSYRLGRNTTYCYTQDEPQRLPAFETLSEGLLCFPWPGAPFDFGYPLELSSSIYRTTDLVPLIEELGFHNPNSLEAGLAALARTFSDTRGLLGCYAESVAFSVPANMVQAVWKNRVGRKPELALGELQERFDRGERIDIDAYRGYVSSACHEEVAFRFRRDPAVPSVSVVIPCFDQAAFLEEAATSVFSQTFDDWEIVIVDDGSTDDTAQVATALIAARPQKVRLISQPNRGVSVARNAGISHSLGQYILPLDADDAIRPTMLEVLVAALDQRRVPAIAYTDIETFGEAAAVQRAGTWSADALSQGNQLSYCSMYHREVWEAVGGYNPNMSLGYEDWDFWVGAAAAGYDGIHVTEPLFRYRIRHGSRDAHARRHDAELRAQIERNHPQLFTLRMRVRRSVSRRASAVLGDIRRMRGIQRDRPARDKVR